MSTEEEVNEIKSNSKVCGVLKRKEILKQRAIAKQRLVEKVRKDMEERKKKDEDAEFLKKIDDFLKTLKLNLKF